MTTAPRTAGRPKRGERTLDRAMVGRATLQILKEQGPNALSITKIADQLGVRSQSLYYHVKTVADAVNAARGVLFSEVDVHSFRSENWEESVVDFALAYYRAFSPLKQSNTLFFLHEITDPNTLQAYEAFLVVAKESGVQGAQALRLLLDLEHTIFALIFEQSSWHSLFSPEAIEREGAKTLKSLLHTRAITPEAMESRLRHSAVSLVRGALRESRSSVH